MNFPRPEKIIRPPSGNSSRLGVLDAQEASTVAFQKENDSAMNFPRPGKIIRSLSGRSPGFVGLDGQKAYMMNFRRATKKHLAA